MKDQLERIKKEFDDEISNISNNEDLEHIRVKYLGKKGKLTSILKMMGKLSAEERPIMGKLANEVREYFNNSIEENKENLRFKEYESTFSVEKIDITKPGKEVSRGSLHPLTITKNKIVEIFSRMGFTVERAPEIDTVFNNFDALNAPKDHPSRSRSDTFYFDAERLLRTHTSAVQIRTMLKKEPPIKAISYGRCFRNDEIDATHSPMFNQIEGIVIGKNITMANLKYTMETFVNELFGEEVVSVFRTHNFPFTEPSAEVDISCFKCKQKGCKFCGGTGFIEILGCGMCHPNVLERCGVDSSVYSGFAFGMGIDRITMLNYEIDDIRYLFDNDIRFLEQFGRKI